MQMAFICVDTPSSGGSQHYDHSKLGRVLLELGRLPASDGDGSSAGAAAPLHVVVCCTVIPGYMDTVAAELLGLTSGGSGSEAGRRRLTLSYNPLFIAQGAILQGIRFPDLVLIGEQQQQQSLLQHTKETEGAGGGAGHSGDSISGRALERLWGKVIAPHGRSAKDVVRRMPMLAAEVAKLSLNCYGACAAASAHLSRENLHLRAPQRGNGEPELAAHGQDGN